MNEADEIKGRIDIVDFITQYVEMKKAGINYSSCCPFHNEKTPSFMVSPERQSFRCFGCFPKGELIQTQDGFLAIEKIRQGDKVFTGAGRLKSVNAIIGRNYDGDLLEIQTRMVNHKVSVTGDHKIFVIKTRNCKQKSRLTRICQKNCQQNCPTKFFDSYKIEKISARELKTNDLLLYPVKQPTELVGEINILDYADSISNLGKNPIVFDPNIKIDEVFAELIGYYIAEGSNHRAYIRFSLSHLENDLANRILDLTEEIFGLRGSKYLRHGQKHGLEVTICNSILAQAFAALCGKGSNNKQVPEIFFGQSDLIKEVLVRAILEGDGTITKNYINHRGGRKSIKTMSFKLAHQLKDILLSVGQRPNIIAKDVYISKDGIRHQPSYEINWRENDESHFSDFLEEDGVRYWTLPIRSISRSSFSGYVYNLNVNDDHSYLTPSFAVANCGEGGDVITFFQKIEGLSFPEALKILGERVGVEVRFSSRDKIDQNKNDKDRLFKINLLAAKFFKMSLQAEEGKLALQYLHDRGVKDEVIEKFKVGFAPNNDKLRRIFNSKEIHDADMSYAGHPERFRYRIMFPILDNFSQIIGFSGRILEDQLPANVSVHPKYLNTPETPVFHKSKALYGINLAKETIRKNKRVVIVEGQMDVLMSHQAGIEEVVASSGTALTEDHLKSLSRLAPNIIFSFDEDEAGIKAAHSAIITGLSMGLEVKLTTMEKYKDVGELVEAEPDLWGKIVESALPPVEWVVARATKGKKSLSAQEKKELAKSVLGFIVRMKDEVEKAHYVQYLSKVVGVPPIAIEKSLNQIKVKSVAIEQVEKYKLNLEEYYLAFLLNYPKVVSKYTLAPKVNFDEKELEEIYKSLYECYNSEKIAGCIKEVRDRLSREISERLGAVCLIWDERFSESEDLAEQEFVSVKLRFEDREKEKIKDGFAKMISDAEISGDLEKVKELMKKLQAEFKK